MITQRELETRLQADADGLDRDFPRADKLELRILARMAVTPLEKRRGITLRQELALAGLFVVMAALLVIGIGRLRTVNQPVPARPSPSVPSSPVTGIVDFEVFLVPDGPGIQPRVWALLANCSIPSTNQCGYYIASSTGFQQIWSNPVQVGPLYDRSDGGAPKSVRFLNGEDGFVYGSGAAFVTHDGGRSWGTLDVHAAFIAALAVGDNTVWSVTDSCASGTSCSYQVRWSHDAGRSWSAPHSLPAGFSPSNVVPLGHSASRPHGRPPVPDGLLISSMPSGDMEITLNGGAPWRSVKTHCAGKPYGNYVATPDGVTLWQLCVGNPKALGDSADKVLFVSTDGGDSWTRSATSQIGGGLPEAGTSVIMVAPEGLRALIGTDRSPVVITINGLSTFNGVRCSGCPRSGWYRPAGIDGIVFRSMRGFRNPSWDEAWALDANGNIWMSMATEGESWSLWPPTGQRPW